MSKLPRYDSYKESGVQWLGEVPSHWEVIKMKFVITNVGDKVNAKESNLRYFGLENIESFTGKLINAVELESEGIGHKFQKNDVLFGKLRPYLAKVFLAKYDGLSSTEALVFRSSEIINPNFLSYYCLSQDFINEVNGTTFGSKMPRASWDDIASFKITYPKLDEQKQIANYLDYHLAKVDALIAKQEALLEKMAEQRIALISHAVTKGLNSDVEMKQSGVEWLGEIPSHWEVKQLKFAVTCNDETLGDKTDSDYEILYIDISSVSLIDGIKHKEELVFEDAPSRARRIVQSGDVLVSTVRTYLKAITYVERAEHNLIASTGFAILRPTNRFDSKFIGYWIQSEGIVGNIVANSVGVSYPAINSTDLIRLPIVDFSLSEQKQIVDYLDHETGKIDKMVEKVNQTIHTLKEYRSTLITQVVTGKVDVRNLEIN
ncbi:restriction endonuclease subunit S [Acinetobacter nectaris]|uniref:restriction endonuclease subunit S n=1 Tax=Acinetobacter nectaris TaxID=1219382 RepID=UPI001F1FF0BC|nr:restriction endonuclease subunit S [Acinetobacter nectaris]MCF8999833.1 restriction endonuclease subunit S [Acinetobacter nectaris]MCF9026746.1 restriction endonuclease subunit S [Acinetobacter nectaris]